MSENRRQRGPRRENQPSEEHRIVSRLGEALEDRGMTLTELSQLTGITMANLSILKNGRAKAVRFSSLTLICDALDCTPGDIIDIRPGK